MNLTNAKLRNVKVRELEVVNEDTLCCHFYPYAQDSLNIKTEICGVFGCFNGFFKNGDHKYLEFKNYSAVAYDKSDNEIMYAVCSKETSELIGAGRSLEWLKLTTFQENTSDYRIAQAKRIIGEIENTLRDVIKQALENEFGEEWWQLALDNKLGNSVKSIYKNQFGDDASDGSILIQYTYTLDLKKIVLTHWKRFSHLFISRIDFENAMDALNKIRREEAYNRPISDKQLNELKKLHENILSTIIETLATSMQSTFLLENWRLKIKKIMETPYKPLYKEGEIVEEPNMLIKHDRINKNISNLLNYLNEVLTKLRSVSAPIHKKKTHDELISHFETFRDLHVELLDSSKNLNFDVSSSVQAKIDEQKKKMDDFVERFLLSEG